MFNISNKYYSHINVLLCLIIFAWGKSLLAQQAPVSISAHSVYMETQENILNPTKNVYSYSFSTTSNVGQSWNTNDLNPVTYNQVRLIKVDYGTLTNSTINHIDFKFNIKKLIGNEVFTDVYLYNGDRTNSNPQAEYNSIASSNDGVFIKTIKTTSQTTTTVTITMDYEAFKNTGNSSVFTIVMKPNTAGSTHVNQVVEVTSESVLRYATGPCNYDLGRQKFLIHNGDGIPTLNTIPVMCLGGSNWWINANRTLYGGCSSLKTDIPLTDHKIFMTVWQCYPDLTRISPANYLEWEQLINRGSATSVDWFDLKANLPPGGGDFFKPNGVYELWLWIKNDNGTVRYAGNRYFHVWTDDGNVSNYPAYGVNLIQNNITISNSTIKNIYSQEGLVDILAASEILILPGSGKSELEPNTWYHISASGASCNASFSVNISGPRNGNNSGTYTWTAAPSIPSYQIASYSWSQSLDGTNYYPISTSSSISQQLPYSMNLYLMLTVTAIDGHTATAQAFVRNTDAGHRVTNGEASDFNISPNPGNGLFNLVFVNDEVKNLYIYDVMGNIVYEQENITGNYTQVDLASKPIGIYLVKIISGDKIISEKIIIQ